MVRRFLAIFHGRFVVRAGDHGSVAEDADFHLAQRGGVYVGGYYLGGSLGLGLAFAVRGGGDPIIGYSFVECRRVVIFLRIEPGTFHGLQSLRDVGIGIGFGLFGQSRHRSRKKQTEETDGSDKSSWHSEAPCKTVAIILISAMSMPRQPT